MSKRARMGLGFVVLAALLWLIALPLQGADGGVAQGAFLLVGVAMVVCAVVGLVMLAWGLIRD